MPPDPSRGSRLRRSLLLKFYFLEYLLFILHEVLQCNLKTQLIKILLLVSQYCYLVFVWDCIVSASDIFIFLFIYLFIYLIIYLSTRTKSTPRGFQFGCFDVRRMGSSILCPVYVSWAAISFFSCWFFADFEDFCAVLLVYKVSGSRFPF